MPEQRKLAVLDPGHGGRDPGCSAKLDGTLITEAALARKILFLLKDKLQEDRKIDVKSSFDIGKKITSETWDVKFRRRALAVYDAKIRGIDLLVSLHMNAVESDSPNGLVICHYKLPQEAQIMYDSITAAASAAGYDLIGDRVEKISERPRLALLNNSGIPALLIECGFLSNSDDLKFLASADGQLAIAEGVQNGIYKILNIA